MLLNVVSTSTVADAEAVTVESNVNAPELGVAHEGKPDPALVSTCPFVPAAPARVKAVVKLADAIVGAVSVLLVSVCVPVSVTTVPPLPPICANTSQLAVPELL